MSGTLSVGKVQLGDSTTATNNFVLQTNTDGTAKLARGNVGATTQDILTVDAAGKVVFPQMAQTWQSPTRANATNYTNDTGNPIAVSLTVTTSNGTYINLTVGGIIIATVQSNIVSPAVSLQMFALVPSGAVYRTDGTATISSWKELR